MKFFQLFKDWLSDPNSTISIALLAIAISLLAIALNVLTIVRIVTRH